MKITDKFKPGKTLFAFELLPPLKGDNIDTIFDTIGRLAPYNPSYINVTYHREEVKLIERPDGSWNAASYASAPERWVSPPPSRPGTAST